MNQPTPEALRVTESARKIAIQMLQERGRGAVLVGVARVDAALENLLLAVMAPVSAHGDNLFLPDRPLGSIGAKVALASRLGLIDTGAERAIHTLRKLRNAFAHSTESASLNDPVHSSRLADTYEDARANPLWKPLETVLAAKNRTSHDPADPALLNFILLATVLVAFLEATAHKLEPKQPNAVMSLRG